MWVKYKPEFSKVKRSSVYLLISLWVGLSTVRDSNDYFDEDKQFPWVKTRKHENLKKWIISSWAEHLRSSVNTFIYMLQWGRFRCMKTTSLWSVWDLWKQSYLIITDRISPLTVRVSRVHRCWRDVSQAAMLDSGHRGPCSVTRPLCGRQCWSLRLLRWVWVIVSVSPPSGWKCKLHQVLHWSSFEVLVFELLDVVLLYTMKY